MERYAEAGARWGEEGRTEARRAISRALAHMILRVGRADQPRLPASCATTPSPRPTTMTAMGGLAPRARGWPLPEIVKRAKRPLVSARGGGPTPPGPARPSPSGPRARGDGPADPGAMAARVTWSPRAGMDRTVAMSASYGEMAVRRSAGGRGFPGALGDQRAERCPEPHRLALVTAHRVGQLRLRCLADVCSGAVRDLLAGDLRDQAVLSFPPGGSGQLFCERLRKKRRSPALGSVTWRTRGVEGVMSSLGYRSRSGKVAKNRGPAR